MKLTQFLASVTLIALPLYVARCKDFSWCVSPIPFTFLETLILATVFSWVCWRYNWFKTEPNDRLRLFKGLTGPLFWPLVVFLVISVVSLFTSPDLRAAAGVWRAYFLEPAIFFIVVLDLSIARKDVTWLTFPILFSGFWVAAFAVWQSITGADSFAPDAIHAGRATSVYNNPNAIGLYLGPIFLVSLGVLFELIKKKRFQIEERWHVSFVVVCLVIFTLAIYLSKSRGSGVGLVAALVFFLGVVAYGFLRGIPKKVLRYSFFALVALFFLFSAFVLTGIDRYAPAKAPRFKNSITVRLCIWQATKRIVSEDPVTGVGLSGFPIVYPKFATCESFPFQYPHNIFLNFLVEMGGLGLIAFLWIIFSCFKILFKFKNDFVAAGVMSSFVYIFIHGVVDVPYFKNDLAALFWTLLAITAWFEYSLLREVKKKSRT